MSYDKLIDIAVAKSAGLMDNYSRRILYAVSRSKTLGEAIKAIGLVVYPKSKVSKVLFDLMSMSYAVGAISVERMIPNVSTEVAEIMRIFGGDDIKDIMRRVKAKSNTIALDFKDHIGSSVEKQLIKQYIGGNQSIREAVKAISAKLSALGITQSKPHHLRTVMDTAATSAARWGEYQAQRSHPGEYYWTYHTQGDDRVRPAHRQMDGRTYHMDDPVWQTWYPPNGYNCRCYVTSSSRGEYYMQGYPQDSPDVGFTGTPDMFFKA